MPTYKVTAPDGRTVKLTGDSPPTDADLDDIFTNLPAKQAPKTPEGPSLGGFAQELGGFLGRGKFMGRPEELGKALGETAKTAAEVGGPLGYAVGVPATMGQVALAPETPVEKAASLATLALPPVTSLGVMGAKSKAAKGMLAGKLNLADRIGKFDAKRLANDPDMVNRALPFEEAKQVYAQTVNKLGLRSGTSIIDDLFGGKASTTTGQMVRYADRVYSRLKTPKPGDILPTAQEMLYARQAYAQALKKKYSKNAPGVLTEFDDIQASKNQAFIDGNLDRIHPELKEARKVYSEAATVDKLNHFFPQNVGGGANQLRLTALAAGAMAGPAGLATTGGAALAQSPLVSKLGLKALGLAGREAKFGSQTKKLTLREMGEAIAKKPVRPPEFVSEARVAVGKSAREFESTRREVGQTVKGVQKRGLEQEALAGTREAGYAQEEARKLGELTSKIPTEQQAVARLAKAREADTLKKLVQQKEAAKKINELFKQIPKEKQAALAAGKAKELETLKKLAEKKEVAKKLTEKQAKSLSDFADMIRKEREAVGRASKETESRAFDVFRRSKASPTTAKVSPPTAKAEQVEKKVKRIWPE